MGSDYATTMVMEVEQTRRLRQRQQLRITSSSSSLVMAAAAVTIAGVALLATCCQADLAPVIGGGNNAISSSSSSRRTRREGSLRGGGFDINDNDSYSATTAAGVDGENQNKTPKTFLIKFRDGLAQTRSLEIHHSSRRHRRRLQKQQRRATRGEDGAFEQKQTQDIDRKKWQSRARSISSISDERHIAIVEMMDPDSDQDGEYNDVAAVTSSTASEIMYDELMADEDVELVEEVRMRSYGS